MYNRMWHSEDQWNDYLDIKNPTESAKKIKNLLTLPDETIHTKIAPIGWGYYRYSLGVAIAELNNQYLLRQFIEFMQQLTLQSNSEFITKILAIKGRGTKNAEMTFAEAVAKYGDAETVYLLASSDILPYQDHDPLKSGYHALRTRVDDVANYILTMKISDFNKKNILRDALDNKTSLGQLFLIAHAKNKDKHEALLQNLWLWKEDLEVIPTGQFQSGKRIEQPRFFEQITAYVKQQETLVDAHAPDYQDDFNLTYDLNFPFLVKKN